MKSVPHIRQARFITSTCADAMAVVRDASDALEVRVDDARWPLPKYREMVVPVSLAGCI